MGECGAYNELFVSDQLVWMLGMHGVDGLCAELCEGKETLFWFILRRVGPAMPYVL